MPIGYSVGSMTTFIAVVAYDSQFGIAKDGKIPWSIPADRWFYKQLVADGVVVHSSKFSVIGAGFVPPRRQIVLSQSNEQADSEVYSSKAAAIKAVANEKLVYVLGGGQIYQLFSMEISKVIATEVQAKFDCDTFFPSFHVNWHTQKIAQLSTMNGELSAQLLVYNR